MPDAGLDKVDEILYANKTPAIRNGSERQRNSPTRELQKSPEISLYARSVHYWRAYNNQLRVGTDALYAQTLFGGPFGATICVFRVRQITAFIRPIATLAVDLDTAQENESSNACGNSLLCDKSRSFNIEMMVFGLQSGGRTHFVYPRGQVYDGVTGTHRSSPSLRLRKEF